MENGGRNNVEEESNFSSFFRRRFFGTSSKVSLECAVGSKTRLPWIILEFPFKTSNNIPHILFPASSSFLQKQFSTQALFLIAGRIGKT